MPNEPEKKRGRGTSSEKNQPGNNNEEKPDSLDHRGTGAFAQPPAIVRDAPAASPLRFYARLRHELERRGVDYDRLPRATPEDRHPPCFESKTVYDEWLAAASLLGATVPYRYDMPAEPNYCWDCTPEFKRSSVAAGTCQFPHTRFEKSRTVITDKGKRVVETEGMGVGRRPLVALVLAKE